MRSARAMIFESQSNKIKSLISLSLQWRAKKFAKSERIPFHFWRLWISWCHVCVCVWVQLYFAGLSLPPLTQANFYSLMCDDGNMISYIIYFTSSKFHLNEFNLPTDRHPSTSWQLSHLKISLHGHHWLYSSITQIFLYTRITICVLQCKICVHRKQLVLQDKNPSTWNLSTLVAWVSKLCHLL